MYKSLGHTPSRRQHQLPLTRSQRQGIWPLTSWLMSLATSNVDAKFFGLKPCRNPNLALQVVMMCFNVSMELNGFVPYLRTR
ncbi:hypothetical protein Taro_054896 [Colocasia esculenta]|uniref:Uncharacterized protein n=1 Tax=Colocasia esculenta TaxID=4460 RepID=A0A843XRY6_COLES|nr:hypothetical protein [Colocasia esculenta]